MNTAKPQVRSSKSEEVKATKHSSIQMVYKVQWIRFQTHGKQHSMETQPTMMEEELNT